MKKRNLTYFAKANKQKENHISPWGSNEKEKTDENRSIKNINYKWQNIDVLKEIKQIYRHLETKNDSEKSFAFKLSKK